MKCITGVLHRMFDMNTPLSVCLECWIECLTGMIHGVIHRDAGLGVSKGWSQGINA